MEQFSHPKALGVLSPLNALCGGVACCKSPIFEIPGNSKNVSVLEFKSHQTAKVFEKVSSLFRSESKASHVMTTMLNLILPLRRRRRRRPWHKKQKVSQRSAVTAHLFRMEAHVGLDIEKSRGGNVTIVGLTSGMAADVSGQVWEGDVLESGDQHSKRCSHGLVDALFTMRFIPE